MWQKRKKCGFLEKCWTYICTWCQAQFIIKRKSLLYIYINIYIIYSIWGGGPWSISQGFVGPVEDDSSKCWTNPNHKLEKDHFIIRDLSLQQDHYSRSLVRFPVELSVKTMFILCVHAFWVFFRYFFPTSEKWTIGVNGVCLYMWPYGLDMDWRTVWGLHCPRLLPARIGSNRKKIQTNHSWRVKITPKMS